MFEDKLKAIRSKIAKIVANNHKSVVGINYAMNQFWSMLIKNITEARAILASEMVSLGIKPDSVVQSMESSNRLIQVIMLGDVVFSFIYHRVGSIFDGKNFKLCGRIIIYFGNILTQFSETTDIEALIDHIYKQELGSFYVFNEKLVVYREENGKRSEFDDFNKAINSVLWQYIRDKQFHSHTDKTGGQIVFM